MNDLPIDDSMPVQPPTIPPVNVSPTQPESRRPVPRWRWWVHVFVLTSYVLGIGLIGAISASEESAPGKGAKTEATAKTEEPAAEPALSADPVQLTLEIILQLAIFGVFFGVAWAASRADANQLFLRRNGAWWFPCLTGLGYSVAMRIIIGIVATILIAIAAVWIMARNGIAFNVAGFNSVTTDLGQKLQPNIGHLVDKEAITNSPVYLLLNVTIVSFVLAGLREELWRSGMLAGFRALFPRLNSGRGGQFVFVVLVAMVFGLGHLPQGFGGVLLTTLLGIMLGTIMIFHRSIWEASLAHGFFNALSFVGMHFLLKYKDQLPGIQKMFGGG